MQIAIKRVLGCTDTHKTVSVDTKDGPIEINVPASFLIGEAVVVSGVIERMESLIYVRLPEQFVTENDMRRIWIRCTDFME